MVDQWITLLVSLLVAAIVVSAAAVAFSLIVRAFGHHRQWAVMLRRRLRLPLVALLAAIFAWAAVLVPRPSGELREVIHHVFLVLVVLTAAWFLGSLTIYFMDLGLARYATDGSDGWQARRARTQFLILRRLTVVATVVIAVGAALLTFPGVQAVGATVLASAGLVSVIAGLAAQSTLSNVFAGMQLAFSGAVRVEDVVVVQGEWGYIEEITLTYVVVRIWDERRLVLPSTYFTQQSYENWTRHSTAVLGTVFFDLDWGVDIQRMRAELDRILAESDLWDGEASSLRVTDTVGGFVQVRALVSAADAFAMFDLTRVVREEMLLWLQKQNPAGLPRMRIQAIERDGESFPRARATRGGHADLAAGDDGQLPSKGDETRPPELREPEPEPETEPATSTRPADPR
ncbi:mechanosensitive ion channel family protein [Microbacterium sp. STN6]|uniref:mechanosensitive ion channel family protein n=1 Tax=Microbacterium sp. STN6 TaxID=2995588 RepID=UPI002260BACF|nr:mechanosensitive ion channel family protein [Microbacterium sp. STN6]MCX7522950.1 mechanosensitive ion channel family protein [Microbacterium sp. STN6]